MRICQNCKHKVEDDDAMLCPHCNSELNEKASREEQKRNIPQHKLNNKKNIVLSVILWIWFFPIMATIAILKSTKLSNPIKVGWIVALIIIFFAISKSNDINSNNTIDTKTIDNSKQNITFENAADSEKSRLIGNTPGITKLLNDYNKSAKFLITQDMIRKGASQNNNWVYLKRINIQVFDNSNTIFVDYSTESSNDIELIAVMESFCKALSPKMTKEQFKEAVKTLRKEKFNYYDNYEFSGIKASYETKKLNNGDIRYNIHTMMPVKN